MWIFTAASLMCSACRSVFTARNSTWLMPASIIRLTAFSPAPPTPTTLITARYAPASRAGARCNLAGCSGSVNGSSERVSGGSGSGSGSGRGTGGSGSGSGVGSGIGGVGGSGVAASERRSTAACASSQLGTWSTVRSSGSDGGSCSPGASWAGAPSACRCAASVARKSSASGPSRMLARRRAIEHLLGEVAVHLRRLACRVVPEHGLALHRRLGVAHRLADPRVQHEVAEILLEDLHRLARMQQPAVEHGCEDPLDLDVRIQVLANHRQGVLELDEAAQRKVLALH